MRPAERSRNGALVNLSVAILQHEPETGLGRFADLLADSGVDYELLFTRGRLPDPLAFDAALCLGGSLAAYDDGLLPARRWVRNAVLGGLPYLGMCLGGQLLASALGAHVGPGGAETGVHGVSLTDAAAKDPLFAGLPGCLDVFGWHGDCFELPRGAVPLAGSLACACEAFRFGVAAYGLQFHPEVRIEDLTRWANVPGYRRLLDESGREWEDVVGELERASVRLDELAAQLVERWLYLVAGVAALREDAARVGLAR
jgi:GMP synthase-like glutamine amidotransferase